MPYVYPFTTRVLIGGVEAYRGGPDSITGTPTVLDELSFTWGRDTNVDQPEAGTCTFTLHVQLVGDNPTPMADVIVEDAIVEIWVDVIYPADDDLPADTDSLLVWSGTVAKVDGQPFGDSAYQVVVSAVDPSGPLADETIGDDPWPAEPLGERVTRILDRGELWQPSGTDPLVTDTLPVSVDSSVAGVPVTWRDVDAQPMLGMLQDAAQSVGGVLWVVPDSQIGVFLWLEDPSNRPSLKQFMIDPVTNVVTIGDSSGPDTTMSARDLLRDVQWSRDKSQAINSVDVTWQDQTLDEDGNIQPTSRTITITKPGTSKGKIKKLTVDTELTSELQARLLAGRLLDLTGAAGGWQGSNLQIDTASLQMPNDQISDRDRVETFAWLLSGFMRPGLGMKIIGVPGWMPGTTAVYVEGGTYTVSAGRWLFDLTVSAATAQGHSASAADFAGTTVTAADFGPITAAMARGVSGPGEIFGPGFGAGPFGATPFGT